MIYIYVWNILIIYWTRCTNWTCVCERNTTECTDDVKDKRNIIINPNLIIISHIVHHYLLFKWLIKVECLYFIHDIELSLTMLSMNINFAYVVLWIICFELQWSYCEGHKHPFDYGEVLWNWLTGGTRFAIIVFPY